MESHDHRLVSFDSEDGGYRPVEGSTDPAVSIPSVLDPAAYWRLLRLLSAAQRSRAKHLFLARYAQNKTIAARNEEYAQVCLDTFTECKARLSILMDHYETEVQTLEEYCAQPMVDLETVAELIPKIGRYQNKINLIQSRLQ